MIVYTATLMMVSPQKQCDTDNTAYQEHVVDSSVLGSRYSRLELRNSSVDFDTPKAGKTADKGQGL